MQPVLSASIEAGYRYSKLASVVELASNHVTILRKLIHWTGDDGDAAGLTSDCLFQIHRRMWNLTMCAYRERPGYLAPKKTQTSLISEIFSF